MKDDTLGGFSRRSFVKTTTLATAGLVMPRTLSAMTPDPASAEVIRVGGIGCGGLELFGFEDEAGAFVEVDAAIGSRAVVVMFGDGEFEGVAVVEVVVGTFDVEEVGEFGKEKLTVGTFGGGGGA